MKRKFKSILLYVCRAMGLFAWCRARAAKQLQILCYHGFELNDETEFRPRMFISDTVFRRRLKILQRRGFNVLPLPEAVERLHNGTLPPRSVAITIDDGFYSVYAVAYPALRHFSMPATLYVTTWYVQKGGPVFRLAIQYLFWKTALPSADFSDLSWLAEGKVDLTSAENRLRLVRAAMRYGEENCTEPQRQAIVDALAAVLQVDIAQVRASRSLALMTPAETRELGDGDVIDIQLHTHRHRFPTDDLRDAENEIRENRAVLEQILGKSVDDFCYPSGVWDRSQRHILESLNIRSATTCEIGVNDASTDKYELNRFIDGEDISDIAFEAEISGFGNWLRNWKSRSVLSIGRAVAVE